MEGYQLKLMGTSAGFPDIFVPLPKGAHHGLFIEMKPTVGGRPTENQLDWINHLRQNGYFAEVAHGFEDAKRLFLQYLSQ